MNKVNELEKVAKANQPEIVKAGANLKEFHANLHAFANEVEKNIRQAVISIEEYSKQNAPAVAAIVRSLSEIPNDFSTIQQALAERGWFVLAEMPLNKLRPLKSLIDNSEFEALDKIMCAWTSRLLDETEKQLCQKFPDREALLREGFDNHRNGRHASAITLLLTQADGLCFDSLGKLFFKTNRDTRLPVVSDEINVLGVDAFTRIILHPILIKSGINATDTQVSNGEFPDSPHRHPILHGTVKDYPSELNSLKIVSFVGYMGGVVHKIVEETRNLTASPSAGTTTW